MFGQIHGWVDNSILGIVNTWDANASLELRFLQRHGVLKVPLRMQFHALERRHYVRRVEQPIREADLEVMSSWSLIFWTNVPHCWIPMAFVGNQLQSLNTSANRTCMQSLTSKFNTISQAWLQHLVKTLLSGAEALLDRPALDYFTSMMSQPCVPSAAVWRWLRCASLRPSSLQYLFTFYLNNIFQRCIRIGLKSCLVFFCTHMTKVNYSIWEMIVMCQRWNSFLSKNVDIFFKISINIRTSSHERLLHGDLQVGDHLHRLIIYFNYYY